jgi:DNA-binding winged helix-turn-helix (wHTH) protein
VEGVVAVDAGSESSLQFDLFELDVRNHQLRRSGVVVDLPPQALRILALLTARPNELVTRQEIKDALWPGQSYGDFDSRLNFAIKKLREALGDDAERPRYIQTARSVGYRFIAPVREQRRASAISDLGDSSDSKNNGTLPELPQSAAIAHKGLQRGANRLFLALVAVVFVALAAVVAVFVLRRSGPSQLAVSEVESPAAVTTRGEPGPEINSVSPITPQPRQRIVIKGRGFGLHVPYAHTDSPFLAIRDETEHWAAGRLVPYNWDEVMVDVESWTENEVVISGFSGDYGVKGWKLNVGDQVTVAVWNPQSGVGPAKFSVAVVAAETQ